MPLPEGWHYYTSAPDTVHCGRPSCRSKHVVPSRHYVYGPTGTVDQLYVCKACLWGTTVRYDPHEVQQWISVSLLNPSGSVMRRALIDAGIPDAERRARLASQRAK